MNQSIKTIGLDDLVLWTENPRDPVNAEATDREIILRAIENESGNWDLDKMLSDLGNQYYYNEIPTVVKTRDGKYVVYDGNRRVAVLKCVQDPELYQIATNKLPLFTASEALVSQTSLPCNVCDRETALEIVERTHAGSGKWGRLQYEQFEYHHRGKPKGRLMVFDEATDGAVGRNRSLNEEYVQNRLLTDANLESVGLAMVDGELRTSLDSLEEANQVLQDIIDMKDKKLSSARKNAGDLLGALRELNPERYQEPRGYDADKSFSLSPRATEDVERRGDATDGDEPLEQYSPVQRRRKPTPKRKREPLFGETLRPKGTQANEIYRAIDWMWLEYCKKPDTLSFLLPIMGFSLRLLLESVARDYYMHLDPPQDMYTSAVGPFMKTVVRPALRDEGQKTELAQNTVASELLNEKTNFDSLLHNWAHGTIDVDETLLVREAHALAAIIKRFGE